MRKLEQMVRQQLTEMLKENSIGGMSIHPFANHLANQPDVAPQEDLYDGLANAIVVQIISVDEKMVRDEARIHCKAASQGPNGIGGRFNDEQLEEIITRVYDKLNEIAKSLTGKNMNMRSYLPQDREHPQYMDME